MFSKEQGKKSADKPPEKGKEQHEKESSKPRRKANALWVSLEGVRQLSDMLQKFTDLIPAAGLNPALKTLSTIIEAIQDAEDNKEALKENLLPRIERIRDQIVTPLFKEGNEAERVRQTANSVGSRLASAIDKIGEKVEEMGKQGRIVRFIYHKVNKADIQKLGGELEGILSEFTLEKISQLVATGQKQLDIAKDTHKIILAEAQQKLIDDLPHVASAYDSKSTGDMSLCAPNTQKIILGDIENWAASTDGQRVYWLCGLAGTGKSTICRTIADWLDSDSRRQLGASYFFSRDDTNLENADSLFPTLAYQLSLYSPDFGRAVAEVLSKKRDTATKTLLSQCQALLSKPLETTGPNRLSPIVIVIDAVDKCSLGTDTAAKLLAPLIDAIRSSPTPIRLLVSSRPEPEIEEFFDSLEPNDTWKSSKLHEVNVHDDIRIYLQSQFDEMRRTKPKLSRNWITAEEVDTLVAYAIPLFIVAALMVNFAKKARKDPRQQVKILLDQSPPAKRLPYSRLDSLYLHALASAYREDGGDDNDRNRLKLLLATIVTLKIPMSVSTLAAFLSIDDGYSVLLCLQSVSSVLIIPESVDDTVRIFHASFREFITDASRCSDPLYYVRDDETQGRLALQCLHVLNTELRPDICGLGAAPYANADILDLINQRLGQRLPQHVLYSCLYLSSHVISTQDDDGRIASALETFCLEKLLIWIEVLGLSRQVDVLLSNLQSIGEWYQKHVNAKPRLVSILYDAFRFVSRFREAIETSTGDIYGPLLALMPSCEMKDTYLALPSARFVCGLPPADKDWGSFRWAAQLRSEPEDDLRQLAFSPNGKFLITTIATSTGTRCRVWNAGSGAMSNEHGVPLPVLTTLEPLWSSQPGVNPVVAFSPDSTSLACADIVDTKLWIYSLTTSAYPRALTVNSGESKDQILLVAYVQGGNDSLLVVTRSGHINIWSTNAEVKAPLRRIFTPTSSGDEIIEAAASEDGHKLAILRNDIIVDVWDIVSGRRSEEIFKLSGPKARMRQMLFLARGNHLAVHYTNTIEPPLDGTSEMLTTLKIFGVETGHCLKSVHDQEHVPPYVVYMANTDGRLTLLYGSIRRGDDVIHMYTNDYTSYIKLITLGDIHRARNPLNSHSVIAFSADGLVLAVGSNDVMSVHDVNSLKEDNTDSLSDNATALSHGPGGTLYDVMEDAEGLRQVTYTVPTEGSQTNRDTSVKYRLRKGFMFYLRGCFGIVHNSGSLLVTDLRTGQPCFGFSIKGASPKGTTNRLGFRVLTEDVTDDDDADADYQDDLLLALRQFSSDRQGTATMYDELLGKESKVSADGHWMAIRLRSGGSWGSDGKGEVWVCNLVDGAFVATPWTPGAHCDTDIQLALDGRSFLTAAYNHDKKPMTPYAVWELDPSNPFQATKKGHTFSENHQEIRPSPMAPFGSSWNRAETGFSRPYRMAGSEIGGIPGDTSDIREPGRPHWRRRLGPVGTVQRQASPDPAGRQGWRRDQFLMENQRQGKRMREMVGLLGSGINKKPWYTGDDDYIWVVVDPKDSSSKSYVMRGESFLDSTPGKSSPRFLIVWQNRIEIQVGEVKRRLCWIPAEWYPENWVSSSWSGSELAFRTKNDGLIRINTDELEESLYGSRLEWS